MISWDYLPLTLAAEELSCTEEHLTHLAANRKARIHVLTGGRASCGTFCFDEHDRLVEFRKALPNICLVPFEFWARREAGEDCGLNSLTSVDSKNMPGGIGDVLYSAPWYDCTGKDIEFNKFVILRDELEKLRQIIQSDLKQKEIKWNDCASQGIDESKPWLIENPNDPAPDQPWYIPARYFARQYIKEDPMLLNKRDLLAKKVAKKLSSVEVYKRGGKKPLNHSTVLKAFTNITLG